jgi:hypothetical protein
MLDVFERWLENAKTEMETPDLWVELQKAGTLIALEDFANKGDDHFTPEQINELEIVLVKIKQDIIKEINPIGAKIEFLDEKISYLVESAKKQNLRDWRNIAFSTLVQIAVTLTITPEKMTFYGQMISSLINKIKFLIG